MDINFYDTYIAFRGKTNKELQRAYLLFRIMKNRGLIRAGTGVLMKAMKFRLPVSWIVEATIYKQFVGGRSISECLPIVKKMSQFNVHAILDYSVEGNTTPEGMDRTMEETLRTIDNASGNDFIPFAVFKPTAFASKHLFDNAVPGKPLDNISQSLYSDFQQRVDILCKRAYELNVPILIDAEETWYQHLVDETVEKMMEKYNTEKAIVYNTLQMYRHDRVQFLKESIEKARSGKYFLGVKFVRGAYMERERFRALQKGYPSPICNTKEETDNCYNEALVITLNNIDTAELFSGTHNEESNLLLVREMKQRNLAPNDRRIWISQLYGMSDHISFNLAYHNFNVAKYVPYGPVKSVMPYLVRRAEENTAIAGQTTRELSLIEKERLRRKVK
ncbi:MAG TPA: proline dehydrogenase family protein [Lentimicrobium sp.]|nr:proline dehydrogenase family protein [Lentimicrobium sp.]